MSTVARAALFCAVGLVTGCCCNFAQAATMAFDGYETPPGSNGYISFNNTVSDSEGRSYTGYAGIATSLWGSPHSGNQYLFIENFASTLSSVTQTYVLDPGTYSLSYYESGRATPYGALTYDLIVDSIVLGSYTTNSSAGATYVLRTSPNFTVGISGMTTVTYQGTFPNAADNMGLFDDLTITAVPEPGSLTLLVLGLVLLGRRSVRR